MNITQLKNLYMRVLENCKYYEASGKDFSLANEIGVLRGIAYSMQTIFGVDVYNLPGFAEYLKVQQALKGRDKG